MKTKKQPLSKILSNSKVALIIIFVRTNNEASVLFPILWNAEDS